MYYLKIISGEHVIEFDNNLWGEEKVKVNGQLVSKQTSILGAQHFFTIEENEEDIRYVLVSKLGAAGQVMIDLFRNGIPVHQNLVVDSSGKPVNAFKKKGLSLLNDYRLDESLEQFVKAKDLDSLDAEIYLFIACIYSLKEDAAKGFENLMSAKQKKLADLSVIDNHDHLAFLRIHPAFEDFKASGYTKYVISEEAV